MPENPMITAKPMGGLVPRVGCRRTSMGTMWKVREHAHRSAHAGRIIWVTDLYVTTEIAVMRVSKRSLVVYSNRRSQAAET